MLTFAVELTIGIRKNENTKETEDLSQFPHSKLIHMQQDLFNI